MKTFQLVRTEDVTGVSGTGVVAEGVVFTDGTAAMRWKTGTASTAVYESIDDVQAIHGHDGATKIVFGHVVTILAASTATMSEVGQIIRGELAQYGVGRP